MTFDELQRRLAEVPARHKEISVIASLDDEPARPSARLLDIALRAASAAREIALSVYDGRPSASRTGSTPGPASTTACSPRWCAR